MRFVHKFNNFINEEWSKNDPIPELTREEKLGIILLGTPGIGKSTFIKEYIHPRNFNLKVFSTDDVSLTFTKDPNVYHQTASDLNLNRLLHFLETEQGFIYDTTGTQEKNILQVYNSAKQKGYKVIFIHLMGNLQQALSGNIQRTRKVPEDYLKASYDKQQKSIELYSSLNPDGYYIVERLNSGYNISKLVNKHKVNESYKDKDDVDDIIETMLDFIDDGENISFISTSGEMNYQDYLDKNTRYDNFKPVMKGGNLIISKFSIIYRPKNKSYDGLIDLMDNMKSCIGRLKDLGWTLVDFDLKSNRYVTAKPVDFSYTQFKFEKPEIVLDEEFKVPEEDEIIDKIESLGIPVREVYDEDDMIRVDFGSNSYDGELNSEAWYDQKFEIVCDFFGFAGYDLQYQKARVYFEY